MADCIDCGKEIPQTPDGVTICQVCVDKRIDDLTIHGNWRVLSALAKIGCDAVVDEATGYEKIRNSRELRQRYEKYLLEGNSVN
jgi:hypothetical protein